MTVRTQQEIVDRLKEAKERDMFGFEWHEYVGVLDAEHVAEFLKPDADASDWPHETLADVNHRAKDYMGFWLGKIEDERGISVVRATMHFTAWKWLLGHHDADTFPGSFDSDSDGGWYQREAYDYIKKQIDSGAWDDLSAPALNGGH